MASLGQLPADIALQILRDLGIRDLAAVAATCRGYYTLANPLLYKLEVKTRSYIFYAAAEAGDVGRMQKFVEAGFDVNQIWYSPFPGFEFEDYHIEYFQRKNKYSKEAVVLYRKEEHKRCKDIENRSYYGSPSHDFGLYKTFANKQLPKLVGVTGQALGINRAYWTALHLAAASGQDKAVSFLIDREVNVDASSKRFCGCPQVKAHVNSSWPGNPPLWLPLHVAICQGSSQTAILLLNRGASIVVEVDATGESGHDTSAAITVPNTRPQNQNRCTALHVACFHRAFGLVKAIIEDSHQSELEVKDRLGQTPFAYAFCAGAFRSVMPYLLSKGCDINVTLSSEREPEEYEQEQE
ncbi:ankyrin repeat-containing domain protein [Xylaria curta]|nr:ankyrin repeat-containing domain protein [Xylaria curta]